MTDHEKNALRAKIKLERKNISVSEKKKMDGDIFDNFIGSGLLKDKKLVLAYVSTDIEAGTEKIISYCLENGIKTAVPRCRGGRVMDFFLYDKNTVMERSRFGIYEPVPGSSTAVNSFDGALCIVPGLAFDKQGFRLGYGGGFYDAFLENMRNITAVGICYSSNIYDKLPTETYDKKVNFIVTDKFTEECNG